MIQFYKQETKWSCGAASMRMVLEFCGIRKTEKQVIKLLGTNKIRGTWAKLYPQLAEKYNLNYSVRRNSTIKEMKALMKQGYIILTSYYVPKERVDHFVIVNKLDKDYIYFYDPFYGPDHKYKLSYFEKIWRTDPEYDNEKEWFISVKK